MPSNRLPSEASRAATWKPIKPAAPVMRMVTSAALSGKWSPMRIGGLTSGRQCPLRTACPAAGADGRAASSPAHPAGATGATGASSMDETGHSRRAVLGLMATAPLGGATAPVAALAAAEATGATIDVRNFGATGDGRADDRTAIQAAIDHALAAGGTLSFTTGVYRVTGPLRFGASVLNGPWSAVLDRTDRLADRVGADPAAEVANKERLRPITVSCTGDVIIAADFEPRAPTPVIEFNLTHYRSEARWNGRCIICPIAQVTPTGYEGYQETTAPAPRNNLIGFALCGAGLKSLSGLHFGYLQCGLASVG